MDLTSVTTAITDSSGDAVTIGLACLGVLAAVKAFTWIRSAFK